MVGLYAVGYKFGFMINVLLVQPFFVMWQSRMYAIYSNERHLSIFRQIFVFVFAGVDLRRAGLGAF